MSEPSGEQAKCDHKYIMLQRIQKSEYSGYQTHFIQRERFVCERCLSERWIEKDDYSRDTPTWWASK